MIQNRSPIVNVYECFEAYVLFFFTSLTWCAVTSGNSRWFLYCTSWEDFVDASSLDRWLIGMRNLSHLNISVILPWWPKVLFLQCVTADASVWCLFSRFGRKPTLFGSLLILTISSTAATFAPSFPVFTVLFMLMGFSQMAIYITIFVLGKFLLDAVAPWFWFWNLFPKNRISNSFVWSIKRQKLHFQKYLKCVCLPATALSLFL